MLKGNQEYGISCLGKAHHLYPTTLQTLPSDNNYTSINSINFSTLQNKNSNDDGILKNSTVYFNQQKEDTFSFWNIDNYNANTAASNDNSPATSSSTLFTLDSQSPILSLQIIPNILIQTSQKSQNIQNSQIDEFHQNLQNEQIFANDEQKLRGFIRGLMDIIDGIRGEGWDRVDKVVKDRVEIAGGGVYSGEMLFGLPHGQGSVIYPNGDTYSGHWSIGKYSNHGKYRCREGTTWGDEYAGEYRDGMYHGMGIYKHSHGGVYNGYFAKECKQGPYYYTFPDGKSMFGLYSDNVENGPFVWTSADKQSIKSGHKISGLKHGEIRIYALSKIETWKDGNFIKENRIKTF